MISLQVVLVFIISAELEVVRNRACIVSVCFDSGLEASTILYTKFSLFALLTTDSLRGKQYFVSHRTEGKGQL